MSFGNKLKELRKLHNLTQEQMSERIKMEQSNYNRYENDKRYPNIEIVDRVANEFNVTREWLLPSNTNQVFFNDGAVNNGTGLISSENYYAIPKDMFDAYLIQQKALEQLLNKLLQKM